MDRLDRLDHPLITVTYAVQAKNITWTAWTKVDSPGEAKRGDSMRAASFMGAAGALLLTTTLAFADITVRYQAGKPVSISGITGKEDCHPYTTAGAIATREFDKDGLWPQTVVVEEASGERVSFHVSDFELADASLAVRDNARQAIQVLTRVGRKVKIGAYACGVSGRVQMLHSISAR